MEVYMKKNIVLTLGFISLPILVNATSTASKTTLLNKEEEKCNYTDINNDCLIEKDDTCSNGNVPEIEGVLVEERGVGEILETSGNFITNAGSKIAEVGDDCEEEDNIVEATGKCLHYFGKIFTIIGKFLKKLFF